MNYLIGINSGRTGFAIGNNPSTTQSEVLIYQRGDITYRSSQNLTTVNYNNPTIFNSRNTGSGPQQIIANATGVNNYSTGSFGQEDNRRYIIGDSHSNTDNFNGTVAEVLSFSVTQNAAEKRNIETYLALKYGITLNPGNYTIGGTTVFNTTTFSGFTNDVVGIASYAKYDFLQTTSKSVNSGAVLTISNPGSFHNNDFLVIGNNGGAMSSTAAGVPAEVGERVVRKWVVQMTNTPGTVTLSFDLSGYGYASKNVNEFSHILDTDSNFGNGISRLLTPTSWSGQVVTFTNVDLNGINYFGMGTAIDLLSDTDTDGIPNYFEIAYGTDPNNGSSPVGGGSPYTDTNSTTGINGDGISDALEKILADHGATVPITRYTDTDKDGITDWIEVKNGTHPFNASSPTTNGAQDTDGDGLPDALEILIVQTGGAAHATFTSDTDGDGIPDYI